MAESMVWIDCPTNYQRKGETSDTYQSWDHGAIPADSAEWFDEVDEQSPDLLPDFTVSDREGLASAIRTYGEPRIYDATPDLRAFLAGEGPWTLQEGRVAAYMIDGGDDA